jgi:hypothetical protein
MLTLKDYANRKWIENTPDYGLYCKVCDDFAGLEGEIFAEDFEAHYEENHPFELSVLRNRGP